MIAHAADTSTNLLDTIGHANLSVVVPAIITLLVVSFLVGYKAKNRDLGLTFAGVLAVAGIFVFVGHESRVVPVGLLVVALVCLLAAAWGSLDE